MRPIRVLLSISILLCVPLLVSGSAEAPLDVPEPPPDPNLILTILGPGYGFGWSITNVGDFDRDGYEDLLVAEPGWYGGSAFLYLGGAPADTTFDLVFRNPSVYPTSGYGASVASGDLNGDGYSDIAIGDPFTYPQHDADAACYVYLGGSTPDPQQDLILHNPEPQSWTRQYFGTSLSIGDLDRDGFADLAVGKTADPLDLGRVYLRFGAPTLGGAFGLSVGPPQAPIAGWGFPTVMTRAGDVDGDGFEDLLVAESGVGAPPCPAGHGRATLFLGGAARDTLPDAFLAMTPFSLPAISQPISSAGDFNGDGFDDLVVGAPVVHADGSVSSGRAYVYFGSGSPASYAPPDLVLAGESDSTFGQCIHGGKDVNGDGFPDVLVATTFAVFVYFGGPSADAVPDLSLRYDSVAIPGGTILTAWDWNGDGIAEVMVGSPMRERIYVFDASTPLEGSAFTRGGQHVIPFARPGDLTLQVQPVGGSYENAAVDPSTLMLSYRVFGGANRIPAIQDKMTESDTNHDEIPELAVSFRSEDFQKLFAPFEGRQDVDVAVEGRLTNHRRFSAPATLTIQSSGRAPLRQARISPNPLQPEGTLEFSMPAPGRVSLRLYDVNGRCVRTFLRDETFARGSHRMPFAARDDRGGALASGVYFYRLELPEGVQRGRFVVAK